MMETVHDQNSYAECAKNAFLTAETISINESGGVEPLSDKVWTEILEYGKTVVVAVNYTLRPYGGCSSDSAYHVIEPYKVRKAIYKFEDGVVTKDGGPIFEEPWLNSSRSAQNEFYERYKGLIKALAA